MRMVTAPWIVDIARTTLIVIPVADCALMTVIQAGMRTTAHRVCTDLVCL